MASVSPVRFGEFLVDPEHNQLIDQAGKDRSVSPLLMDILCHLIANRDRVVSSDELLAEFWADRVVEESTIHRRINQLRSLLGDSARSPRYIRTISKRGYQAIGSVADLAGDELAGAAGTTPAALNSETAVSDGRDSNTPDSNAHVSNTNLASPTPPDESRSLDHRPRTAFRLTMAGLALVALIVTAGALLWWAKGQQPPAQTDSAGINENSIAVLPFVNLGDDEVGARFARGIHDDVTTTLAKVDSIMVLSRMSVMRYAGSTGSPAGIARDLGVRYLLEGSVQREGQVARINLTLTDPLNNETKWASTFDKSLDNVFEVQAEIADAVVAGLSVQMTDSELARVNTSPRLKIMAYDLYREAVEAIGREEKPDLERALSLLVQAEDLERGYAPIYAARAEALVMASRTYLSPGTVRDEAMAAVDQALDLDPESAPAHLAKALVLSRFDLGGSNQHFERAISLDPYDSRTLSIYGERIGGERGLAMLEKARAIDPYSAQVFMRTAFTLQAMGRLDEARQIIDEGLAFAPDDKRIKSALIHQLGYEGDYVELARRLDGLDRNNVDLLYRIAGFMLELGDEDGFRHWFRELGRLLPESYEYKHLLQQEGMATSNVQLLRDFPMSLDPTIGLHDFPLANAVWVHDYDAREAQSKGDQQVARRHHEAIVMLLDSKFGRRSLLRGRAEMALQYGISLMQLDDPRAEETLSRLADVAPGVDEDVVWLTRAKAIAILGDADQAMDLLESNRTRVLGLWRLQDVIKDPYGVYGGLGTLPRFARYYREVSAEQDRLKTELRAEFPDLFRTAL